MSQRDKHPVKLEAALTETKGLFEDIRGLIEEARTAVAATVNTGLTVLYWRVGKRIGEELLEGERAKYGKRILPTLSAILVTEYLTALPSREVLQQKLRAAIEQSHQLLENREVDA